MISSKHVSELIHLPARAWGYSASGQWREMCEALETYEWELSPEPFPLSRKWELASALQKTIRRGDRHLALQLIAKIQSMRPQEHAYFWRRLAVIACEDVGSGNTELTVFVVACSQVFTPVQSKDVLFDVFGFLVERLCAVAVRSRIACTAACILEMLPIVGGQILLTSGDREILKKLEIQERELDDPRSGFRAWQRRNGWRTAGLLKFIDLALPSAITSVTGQPPPSTELHGLPSHTYDMYCRSGREVLRRLIQGVPEALGVRDMLNQEGVREPLEAAGEALFFAEGGYVKHEVECVEMVSLLHRFFATRFGLSQTGWVDLRMAMRQAVADGTLNRLRQGELSVRYSQASLFSD
jgi:hypothetical protein